MSKKVLSIVMVIALFCCNKVYAYDYVNENNKEIIEDTIEQIRDKRDFYEWISDTTTEEVDNVYSIGSDSFWWPIGSTSTTESGGKIFAVDEPSTTQVNSKYGYREDPFTHEQKFHSGIDISGTWGDTNVIAAKSGVVIKVTTGYTSSRGCDSRSYGNYIKIQHADGTVTLYAHLHENTILVKEGEAVTQGQVIAKTGSSGCSTGPHLHFEVIDAAGNQVDPLTYVSQSNPRPVSTTIVGDSNQQTICLTLKNNGFDDNGVAGLMSNMYSESGLNPINLQNTYETSLGYTDETYTKAVDDGTYTNFVHDAAGYGLIQWTFWSLKQNLYNHAKSANKSIGDVGVQLETLENELKSNYLSVYDYMKNSSNNAGDKAVYFCNNFERPAGGVSTCEKRRGNASEFYTYVKNNCQE